MSTELLDLPQAKKRLVDGVLPTSGDGKSSKYVAETVSYFITLMDSLKLNYVAMDQIHPQVSLLILAALLP